PESGLIFGKSTGKPYGRNYDFGLKETMELAGIESDGRKLYAFRHGFCVALANGYYGDHWERAEARDMMRHTNATTTDVYYQVLTHRLADKAKHSTPLTDLAAFERTNSAENAPIKKGATRHGSPLLEAR
ncbi:MAG: hypothetical protein OER77_14460, partial [Myxococcales bacterium]|nr:hypothetical protein [Myxococcales bacterium]